MTLLPSAETIDSPFNRYLSGLAVWVLGWLSMAYFDGMLDLGGLGMLLVLTSAVAAVWLPVPATLVLGLLAVLAFNWLFVPPRGTFAIDLRQHAVLLLVMFAMNAIVALLMSALRAQVRYARQQALAADALRAWGERLRATDAAHGLLADLRQMLQTLTGVPVTLLVLRAGLPRTDDMNAAGLLGEADAEQTAGLWDCLRNRSALGPGSGRYEDLNDVYLPLRGRTMAYGAALVRAGRALQAEVAAQAQDLCDQMGATLERQYLLVQQQASQQTAQEQELRATLLAAIAHEYRTPLATIMGAASALEQQGDRLGAVQRRELSRRIVDEVVGLRQMTGNILQLARLDAPGVQLRCDWESAEELIGSLLQRFRGHAQEQRLQVHVASGLPLLWCDALLISRLLDNLVDNAFKYSLPGTPVHVGARGEGAHVILSVRDEGPGIPEEARAAIFQPFRQGQILPAMAASSAPDGVGIGLALCRVIATAHGGELRLESSARGSCFECLLPLRPQPAQPEDEHDGAAETGA